MEFIIVLLVVFVIAYAIKDKSNGGSGNEIWHEDWPYYAKKPLSQLEQVLYFRLIKALPEHIVLAQVQLSRLLGVEKGNNYMY